MPPVFTESEKLDNPRVFFKWKNRFLAASKSDLSVLNFDMKVVNTYTKQTAFQCRSCDSCPIVENSFNH